MEISSASLSSRQCPLLPLPTWSVFLGVLVTSRASHQHLTTLTCLPVPMGLEVPCAGLCLHRLCVLSNLHCTWWMTGRES
jgi:hypothetical protein